MNKINWEHLENENQLLHVLEKSSEKTQLIFKYSSTCSLSNMIFNRFENDWESNAMKNINPVFLDILSYRGVSNKIESTLKIRHESPQVLVIENGKCIYDCSHMSINFNEIKLKFGDKQLFKST
ncbi:MAG: bacillithiol system redox-active protein YtxJ [Cyclobacteriaceae bacterium]|nr:bacillithiol system redox-active protein YtxJ [Cyclobacteriaceae bacterium]